MKNKPRTFITSLLIGLVPFGYHFAKDIFKMGVKDGKATQQVLAKK
ncbi:MAG TPA: hypothetical protein VK668_11530 [Mucilaginibacter sp.]|nr:hypothetical protein [Mucilaginibacter sp.]